MDNQGILNNNNQDLPEVLPHTLIGGIRLHTSIIPYDQVKGVCLNKFHPAFFRGKRTRKNSPSLLRRQCVQMCEREVAEIQHKDSHRNL